jgi:hypothetical protein
MSECFFDGLLNEFERVPGADKRVLKELSSFATSGLPSDYVQLLRFSNGTSGWLRGRYLIVYSVDEVVAVNRAHATAQYVPGRLIFGSNGGGTSYLLDLGESPTTNVYRCEDVDLSDEASDRIAGSIEEFIRSYGPKVD